MNSESIISTCHKFDKYLKEKNIDKPFLFIPHLTKIKTNNNKLSFPEKLKNYQTVGIYAGTIGKFYNLESLVNNFPSKYKNQIGVLLVGGGDNYNNIKNLIKEKKLDNFYITPRISYDKLLEYYNYADFAITKLPINCDKLYKYGINQLKAADYMINKLPVLFIGNNNFINIDKKNLYLCKSESIKSYNNVFSEIANTTKDRLSFIGEQNFNYVLENNDIKINSKKIRTFINI